jgi:iron complex outermembrane receptor protein
MFKYNRVYRALIGAGLILVQPSIMANTVLDEVVVSASKEGTEIRKTPATIHKVTEEDLDRDKPVFFGDVVNRIPGVFVNNLGAEQHMASMRQPISTQGVYLYLEDGIPIRPVGLFNHNQVYELNMAGIGNVEVIKGPASSLYGSYASGGLMNFLTRAPSSTFQSSVGLQGSDQGYKRLDFGLSGSSESGRQAYRFSGYAFDQKNGWARHSDADKKAFTFRHDVDLGGKQSLKTIFTHTDYFAQMGGGINQDQWNAGQIGASPQTFTFRDVKATRISTAYEGELNSGGLTTATLFYRDNVTNQVPSFGAVTDTTNTARRAGGTVNRANICNNDESGAPPLSGVNYLDADANGIKCGRTLDQKFNSLGIDLKHRQLIGTNGSKFFIGGTLDQGAMSGKEQRYTYNYIKGGPYTSYSSPIDTLRDYSTDFTNYGIYGQGEFVLTPQWLAVLGARYDLVNYDYKKIGGYGVPSTSANYEGISPKAGLIYSPTRLTSIYTNFSGGFAPPEISTKFGGTTQGLTDKTTTKSKEIGLRHAMPELKTYLDVAIYELSMKNAIYNDDRSQAYNADSEIKGLELGLTVEPVKDLLANLSLAFTDQKVVSAPRNNTAVTINRAGKDLRYAPNTSGSFTLAYKFLPKTQAVLESQYVGKYWMDEANTVEYGGHILFHIRITRTEGPWEYWASVRNIADKKYAEFAQVSFSANSYNPGAPRTFLAGVKYNFGAK